MFLLRCARKCKGSPHSGTKHNRRSEVEEKKKIEVDLDAKSALENPMFGDDAAFGVNSKGESLMAAASAGSGNIVIKEETPGLKDLKGSAVVLKTTYMNPSTTE